MKDGRSCHYGKVSLSGSAIIHPTGDDTALQRSSRHEYEEDGMMRLRVMTGVVIVVHQHDLNESQFRRAADWLGCLFSVPTVEKSVHDRTGEAHLFPDTAHAPSLTPGVNLKLTSRSMLTQQS